jgi:aminopeptidase-like protein
MTLVCLGDESPFTYKRTLSGNAEIDRAAALALAASGRPHQLVDYFPFGYDERQYNAPGFRLPVGSLMRGRHGRFPEYHTSADDLDFIGPEALEASLEMGGAILDILDGNRVIESRSPFGEPQLGRRGLYRAMGGEPDLAELELALLWVLTLADGAHTLIDVAERAGLPFAVVQRAAAHLESHELLVTHPVPQEESPCVFS